MNHFHDVDSVCEEQWRVRLEALLSERMRAPFAWATNDCCIFAADAALAVSGTDFAAAERGTYATALSAISLIDALGGLSEIGSRAGPQIPPLMAMLGDIGLVDVEGRESLAVCAGHCWLSPGKDGLVGSELSSATKAWRVSHG